MIFEILEANNKDSQSISSLAEPIWYEHYSPIIGEAQVKYMLDNFQSTEAISQQIEQGYIYYKVLIENELVGYFSVQIRKNNVFFISKFYLSKSMRGKNIGKKMLSFIENLAKEKKCFFLELTVNKNNPAYSIYLKLGFENKGKTIMDIGGGYVMDDFILSKKLN